VHVFSTLFVTCFEHNVSATVSYDQKDLLDIRTAITHPVLDEYFFFNESDGKDLCPTGLSSPPFAGGKDCDIVDDGPGAL
jgi:hypothetical protein